VNTAFPAALVALEPAVAEPVAALELELLELELLELVPADPGTPG
jgi:hypothetical protein